MSSDRDPRWRFRDFARVMRHEPTKGEAILWSELKDRRLAGFKFRRQVPVDGYILDFYCMETKVAVELDGDQHFEGESFEYDAQRDEKLWRRRGIRVLRFPSRSVFDELGLVRESILEACRENPHPCPSPGIPGEGGRK